MRIARSLYLSSRYCFHKSGGSRIWPSASITFPFNITCSSLLLNRDFRFVADADRYCIGPGQRPHSSRPGSVLLSKRDAEGVPAQQLQRFVTVRWMKESGANVPIIPLQRQALEIGLATHRPQCEIHYSRRVLDRDHPGSGALVSPIDGFVELQLRGGFPHYRSGAFDQHVHLADFVEHAWQMTHWPLQRITRPLSHEVDDEIPSGYGDSNIRGANRKGGPQEQVGDAAASECGALEHYGRLRYEDVLHLGTARGGRAHAHRVPVILERQARTVTWRDNKSENRFPFWTIHPGCFAEIQIQCDTLGAEDLAAIHDPAPVRPLRRGARTHHRNRIVRLRSRAAANQTALRDLPELVLDLRILESMPEIDQQSERVEMHIDRECCGPTTLGERLLGFDALQHSRA